MRFLVASLATLVAGTSWVSAQCVSPYTLPKFQAAIAECKLQAPDSSTYFTQAQLIAGSCDDDYFKLADTDKMAFYQTGDSMRTELRYLDNWFLNSENLAAHGNLQIISQTCDQVTVMQIHDDNNGGGGVNKPLLRIYRHLNKTPTDHIWAAIKTDSGGINTVQVDLGATPVGYFDCDITIIAGIMEIAINGTVLDTRDVSYWTYPSYWKAGAYLQDAGEATVYFNELTFTTPSTNQPPAFNSDPIQEVNATKDAPYSSTLANDASDPDTDPMTFSKVSGPAWLSVAGDGTLSGTPGAGDVGLNVFSVQVDATGGTDTTTLNVRVLSSALIELTNDDFESGWGNWTDGGADALLSPSFAIDSQCFDLQDNSSTSVVTLTNSLDLTSYTELQVHFSYVAQSFELGESFFVEYSDNDGSTWSTIKEYVVDVDFADDGTRYYPALTLDDLSYNFTSTGKIRFRCDASNNSDDVYIDNVVIYVNGVNQAPAFASNPFIEVSATEDGAYSSTIANDASDPEGDPMTFSKVSGPAWLSVSGTGGLSGTPGAGDVGSNVFMVQVSASGGSDTATLNITVDAASGGGTVVVVDDSFTDGDRANTGDLEADWWSSNSTGGNSVEAYTGQLGLVTGTSGRGLHGTFTPQTLAIDETLTATLTFTTPATVGTTRSSALKLAIMDFNNPALAADLSSSSSTVNALYTNLPGYMLDLDVNTGSGANTQLREHTTPNTTGRFLGTTGEWTDLGSSSSAGYSFAAATEYVVVFSVTRTGADSVDVFASLSQGANLLDSHTESDASGIANNFGMLGVWANSATFGSTNAAGASEDNGITFSNIKIEVVTATENQPPTFTADPINEIAATQDASYSSTLADDASDPDTDPMTFSKVSGPAWLGVADNGTLSGTPGNTDIGLNVFTVQVDATGGSDTTTLNILVNNVNDPPVAANGSGSVAEDASASTSVTTVSASDPDPLTTLSYSITAGNTGNAFAISSSGEITVAGTLDFETLDNYSLTVEVTDDGIPQLSDTATIAVGITNANESPAASDGSGSIAENASVTTPVTTVSASDPDAGTTLSYDITAGNTGGAFAINSTGDITVASGLDYETTSAYSLTVTVSDDGTPILTDTAQVTVTVSNILEDNLEVLTDFLTSPSGPFPGETDTNIVGYSADPDHDGKPNIFEVWRGSDPGATDQPTPFTLEEAFISSANRGSLTIETDSAMDDALVIGVEMSHDLLTWRDITSTRQVVEDAGGIRTLSFHDTIALPVGSPCFVRFSSDADAAP
ncbi:cadherin domain-containing protein [Haloferula sp.]|uniref:cadherin domain-containing protein n=1 Tax=Haloferula sp. TaxID=2497595 RepID=UPI0032A04B67